MVGGIEMALHINFTSKELQEMDYDQLIQLLRKLASNSSTLVRVRQELDIRDKNAKEVN